LVFAPFSANKSAEQGRTKELKPVEREGRRSKKKHRRQTLTENRGKNGLKTYEDTDRSANTPSTSL